MSTTPKPAPEWNEAARAKLDTMGSRRRQVMRERDELEALVAAAVRADVPYAEIMALASFSSPEEIRAIRKAHGLPPGRPGRRARRSP